MQRSLTPPTAYSECGIVLHTLKYSDNKLIIHLLTKNRGRSNYIATVSSRVRKNIFQPLTIIDFQAVRTKSELGKMTEAEIAIGLHNLSLDVAKGTIAIFIAELLYKIVKEPLDDERMFDFARDSIVALNSMENGVSNFHIWFLVHFAYYLGYQIPAEYHQGEWLDIKSGNYTPYAPLHLLRIAPQYAQVIDLINHTQLSEVGKISLTRSMRVDLLNGLVDYYSYHCDTFGSIKSIEILSTVF